jgi:hypothetical protein
LWKEKKWIRKKAVSNGKVLFYQVKNPFPIRPGRPIYDEGLAFDLID